MIEITDIYIYPVKSLKGIALSEAVTCSRGFKYDREWMVTDTDYSFITQRQIEKMATINVLIDSVSLILQSSEDENNELKISLINTDRDFVSASVWEDTCNATDEGDEASEWLTKILGKYNNKALRLVRFAADSKRIVPAKHLTGDGVVESSFSDQFPYLITSLDSLEVLNIELSNKKLMGVEMNRFRPNIVVKGILDIEQKQPNNLYSTKNNYYFGLRKPCKRCKITTINQNTGEIINAKEPLRTLTSLSFNNQTDGAYFGQNSIFSSSTSALVKVGEKFNLGQ